MKERLRNVFQKLDEELIQEVEGARKKGEIVSFPPMELKIVGQAALLLADLPFPIASTADIDILYKAPFQFTRGLQNALLDLGLILESDQHLIWMPEATEYHPLFEGNYVKVFFAGPLYVIASKCKFQREKDRSLIQNFFKVRPEAISVIEAMGIPLAWLQEKR